MLVETVRVRPSSGIHPVLRVEDGLQLPERAHELVAEHAGQQLAAGLAIAVLTGERTAVGGDQIGGAKA